jgi:hypothetical protein
MLPLELLSWDNKRGEAYIANGDHACKDHGDGRHVWIMFITGEKNFGILSPASIGIVVDVDAGTDEHHQPDRQIIKNKRSVTRSPTTGWSLTE